MQNRGEIIACDVHEHKLKLISDTANRLGISIIKPKLHDGTQPNDEFLGKFNRILIDAPCSGLGVLHKKPDIRYALPRNGSNDADINELTKIQSKLLDTAANYLKPNGTLVYSTCTLLREENSDQIEQFLARHSDFEKLSEQQLLTHESGGSGFYVCKLRRK